MTIQHTLATAAGTALGGIDAFGALGFAFGTSASLMRGRSGILLVAAAAGTCFCIHFLRLGSPSGAVLCALSVVQNLLSVAFVRDRGAPPWIVAAFAACAAAALASVALTWQGWPSALAGAGALLATLARLQSGTGAMRCTFFCASGCWAGHDLLVGSACSLACDLLTMAGFAASGARDRFRRPEGSQGPVPLSLQGA